MFFAFRPCRIHSAFASDICLRKSPTRDGANLARFDIIKILRSNWSKKRLAPMHFERRHAFPRQLRYHALNQIAMQFTAHWIIFWFLDIKRRWTRTKAVIFLSVIRSRELWNSHASRKAASRKKWATLSHADRKIWDRLEPVICGRISVSDLHSSRRLSFCSMRNESLEFSMSGKVVTAWKR